MANSQCLIGLILALLICSCSDDNSKNFATDEKEQISDTDSVEHDPDLLSKYETTLNGFKILFNKENSILEFWSNDSLHFSDSIDPALDLIEFRTEDLNQDGLIDLRVEFADADASIENWYAYNNSRNEFVKISGLNWIVNPKQLASKDFYYTQDPLGCSGNIWTSELIKVTENQIIVFGKIFFDDCLESAEKNNGTSVIFYKINGDKSNVIPESKENEKLLLNHEIDVRQYWEKNNGKYN